MENVKNYFKNWITDKNTDFCAYDPIISFELAKISGLVYKWTEGANAFDIVINWPDIIDVKFYDYDDTQALVFLASDYRIVAFRGTQVTQNISLEDIKSNLDTRLVPWEFEESPVRVHAGYSEAVEDLIYQLNDENWGYNKPIIYTGHSLGGALATIAGLDYPHPKCVYSFGAPMVGNKSFWSLLSNYVPVPVHRVIYGSDMAPRWPFPPFVGFWTYAKYTSGVKPVRINHQGGIFPNIYDHNISKYIRELEYELTKNEK